MYVEDRLSNVRPMEYSTPVNCRVPGLLITASSMLRLFSIIAYPCRHAFTRRANASYPDPIRVHVLPRRTGRTR